MKRAMIKNVCVMLLIFLLGAVCFSACAGQEEERTPFSVEAEGKTEYLLGEEFSPEDLTVRVVYSDGTKSEAALGQYTLDLRNFDTDVPGKGEIKVSLKGTDLTAVLETRTVRSRDSLKILAIGNSFSDDSLEYFYGIAEDCGAEEISLGNLYIPGCTLETHADNMRGDKAAYDFRTNDSGSWKNTGGYSISRALAYDDWDIISLQQGSPVSGMADTYNEDLTDLVAYLQETAPSAMLVWNMTWAYTAHSAFGNYDNDQMKMYRAIVNAVQTMVDPVPAFEIIIPTGTTVQNLRTAWIGDTVTRDGYHLTYDVGRYAAAMTWVRSLTGWDTDAVEYVPAAQAAKLTSSKRKLVKECVDNAVNVPYEVTPSQYTTDPDVFDASSFDPANYTLFDWQPVERAYWYACDGTRFNRLINDKQDKDSNLGRFCSSAVQFTAEDIPVGSVISIAEGWQYRPEGWTDPKKVTPSSSRAANTSVPLFLVTEAFWQEFPCRAFNVSLKSNADITDFSKAKEALKIYIPRG